jgi:hypothetical protein
MELIAEYATEDMPAKKVHLCVASSLEELPTLVEGRPSKFVLFVAADALSVGDEGIRSVAAKLLAQGMVYLCVWGPDGARVEDLTDRVTIERNPNETEADVVVTVWQAKHSLEEAVWFFVCCAYPAPAYERDTSDWIAAAVGNAEWEKRVRAAVQAAISDDKE